MSRSALKPHGGSCDQTPWLWGYWPVTTEDRAGQHSGKLAKPLLNVTPWSPISFWTFGIHLSSSVRMSSTMIISTLGLRVRAADVSTGSPPSTLTVASTVAVSPFRQPRRKSSRVSSDEGSAVTSGAHGPVRSLPRSRVVVVPPTTTFIDFVQGRRAVRAETLTVGPLLSTYTRSRPGSSAPDPTGSAGRLTLASPEPDPSSSRVLASATEPPATRTTSASAMTQVRLFFSICSSGRRNRGAVCARARIRS